MATEQSRQEFERPDQLISERRIKQLISGTQLVMTATLLLYIVVPVLWLVSSSLKPSSELFTQVPVLIPDTPTLENYVSLWNETRFPLYLRNSLIISIGVVVLTTVLSTLAGYGLARARFYGKHNTARSVLLTYMYPPILLAIPLYIFFIRLDLTNSYLSVILAISGRALPFGIWVMWQQFQAIPPMYEESAWVDGASVSRTLFEIIIPMVLPAISAVMVFAFAVAWGEFTISKVLITENTLYPITLGIESFTSATQILWSYVLTSSVITIVPGVLLVVFLQKYLLKGFGNV